MSAFQLNPKAAELDVRIEVRITLLETEGWDFEEYHQNCAEAMLSGAMPLYTPTLEDIEDKYEREQKALELAKEYNYNNYVAIVKVEGTPDEPKTQVAWYNPQRNEDTMWEATGDDQKTIEDIISLLENGFISLQNDADYSVDEDDCYVPSFVEVKETDHATEKI